jgi:hypothetical protein
MAKKIRLHHCSCQNKGHIITGIMSEVGKKFLQLSTSGLNSIISYEGLSNGDVSSFIVIRNKMNGQEAVRSSHESYSTRTRVIDMLLLFPYLTSMKTCGFVSKHDAYSEEMFWCANWYHKTYLLGIVNTVINVRPT